MKNVQICPFCGKSLDYVQTYSETMHSSWIISNIKRYPNYYPNNEVCPYCKSVIYNKFKKQYNIVVEFFQFALIMLALFIGLIYGLFQAMIAVIIAMIIVIFLSLTFAERLYERLNSKTGVQNYILLDDNSKRITTLTACVGLVSMQQNHYSELKNDNILLIDCSESLHIIIKNVLSNKVEFTFISQEKEQLKTFLSNNSEFEISNGLENIAAVKVIKMNL